MYIATQLWYSVTNDETKEDAMTVTQYRGYNLVEGDAGVRILHGTRQLSVADDLNDARVIINEWLDAP